MKKENITKIVVVFLLVCIASVLLYFGFYLKNVSKPNYVFSSLIDSIDLLKDKYFSFDSKYLVGDNFSIDGNVSFEMSSEKYGISSDPSILSKYYMINNLNNTTINYKLMQDIKNKKIYSEVKTNIGTQNVLYNKLLVENATKYYFINSVYSNYINGGSCNYFESLTEENTTKDNIDYLYNFILKSLKNNLKEEYFEKNIVNENILNKDTDVYQISLTIDDKRVKDIFSGILDDLKNDKRAYSILSSSDNNFKKRKVNYNKRILDKKESYTINVFISKSLYKPLKYEIVHILNNDVKSYSYEGSLSVGTIYCIDNGTIKYIGSTTINDKSITIKFSDYLKNDVGILKYEKGVNSSNLNLLFNNGTKSYDLVISSKFVNYNKKNKSYINSISSSFKVTDKKIVVVSGNVKIDNKVSSVVKIDEDTTGAILNSKLSNVAVSKKKNLYNNLRARYEKNE